VNAGFGSFALVRMVMDSVKDPRLIKDPMKIMWAQFPRAVFFATHVITRLVVIPII
jgi:hypothetical protein